MRIWRLPRYIAEIKCLWMCTELENLMADLFKTSHCVLNKSKRVHTYQAKSDRQQRTVMSSSSVSFIDLRSLQSCNRKGRYSKTLKPRFPCVQNLNLDLVPKELQ